MASKKIVYANSGGAGSGEPQYLPVDEKHPIKPQVPYGISKHTVEHYLEVYSSLYDLPYTSLRYANVYGPRQDPFGEGGVIAIFIRKLLEGNAPKIFGSGDQTRDFVYVGDVADANIAALDKGDDNYFNVSTGIETSVINLYDKIAEISHSNLKPDFADERKGEIIRSVLDCTKIKKYLNWSSRVSLIEGLKKTIAFFNHE